MRIDVPGSYDVDVYKERGPFFAPFRFWWDDIFGTVKGGVVWRIIDRNERIVADGIARNKATMTPERQQMLLDLCALMVEKP